MSSTSSTCYCGSEISYAACCKPFVEGKTQPGTPEKLMRSRYSAYVVGKVDYIARTNDPRSNDDFDQEAAEMWSKESEWMGLEVIAAQDNIVEFKARFKNDGLEQTHHEISRFRFDDGEKCWYYVDGKNIQTPVKAEPKIGRNDPCSCGSGKKYKKCCGANLVNS